jgi:hypothetical protein
MILRCVEAATLDEMPATDFVHEIEIRVPQARLHAFLCDLHNYVRLHPLIESIQEISPVEQLPGARRYRVVDRVRLGPFRFRTVYTAALESATEDEIHGHAWQFPGIRLRTIYALERTESGTLLAERVSIEAPLILRRFVVSQARQSHKETLARMKALLEDSSS